MAENLELLVRLSSKIGGQDEPAMTNKQDFVLARSLRRIDVAMDGIPAALLSRGQCALGRLVGENCCLVYLPR